MLVKSQNFYVHALDTMQFCLICLIYIKNYTPYLLFPNGSDGEADIEHKLDGEIFEPLRGITMGDTQKSASYMGNKK